LAGASKPATEAATNPLYALRNRIERFFNRAKNSRRVATRYDKLIQSFAARIWIKFVHTT
jgi:transposase